MKKRVWGVVLTILGVLLLIFPTLSVLNTVKVMPRPDPAEVGNSLVAIARYYNFRFNFLLMAVGVVLLLGAFALFLSPVRRKVPLPVAEPELAAADGAVVSPVFDGEGAALPFGMPLPVFASDEERAAYEAELAKAHAAEAAPIIPRKKTVH